MTTSHTVATRDLLPLVTDNTEHVPRHGMSTQRGQDQLARDRGMTVPLTLPPDVIGLGGTMVWFVF